jgi:hypothetical protein
VLDLAAERVILQNDLRYRSTPDRSHGLRFVARRIAGVRG